ncbi:helix-turn-helix domain-containing protein [Micromonospora sp. NPDC048930]|uniref:helix-turn-helix domain-containing protein n=1 Tax=Micromonospora sp. NPDC048930 TaxID=3364261 RepID=UPI00371FB4F9
MRELRTRYGLTAEQLAERMRAVGVPFDKTVVANLETGRRRFVTVQELLALAYVLSVAPVHLLVPPLDAAESDRAPYPITPEGPTSVPSFVRAWIRGQTPIARVDARRYFSEVPEAEWSPPAGTWTPETIDRQSRAVGDGDS